MKRPRRFWTYPRGQWQGPLVMRGGDEYGRWTLAFRLPGERGLVIALWRCRDPHCETCCLGRCPATGMTHSGTVNGRIVCDDCHIDAPAPDAWVGNR